MQNTVQKKQNEIGPSLNALSEQFKPLVNRLREAKNRCLLSIADAAAIAIEAGSVLARVEQLHLPGLDYRTWAEDNGLPAIDAVKLKGVAERAAKGGPDCIPLKQLYLAMELLPESTAHVHTEDQKTPTFQVHLNKLGQWFSADRVSGMETWVKASVIKQLEEIIARLRVSQQ